MFIQQNILKALQHLGNNELEGYFYEIEKVIPYATAFQESLLRLKQAHLQGNEVGKDLSGLAMNVAKIINMSMHLPQNVKYGYLGESYQSQNNLNPQNTSTSIMAKKSQNEQQNQTTLLMKPRETVKEQITERIQKGKELLLANINSEIVFSEERNKYNKWNSYNTDMLLTMFNTPKFSEDYAYWGIYVGGERTFSQKIGEHWADIDKKIQRLETILEKVDLFEEDKSIIQQPKIDAVASTTTINMEKFDYAIINALYSDELEFIESFIEKEGEIQDNQKLIEYGRLKHNPNKRVIYASLPETGMIDAAIVTTDIISRYKPDYVFMTGVCGGSAKTELGDVVVANKVYVFQKGKETDEGFKRELVDVGIESVVIQKIERAKAKVIAKMKENNVIKFNIHIDPMACSMSVIDKKGFFEEELTTTDRKTMALEMESYGVARACKLANDGKTKAVIMKAVMDKTTEKTDSAKEQAGRNSAIFLKYLLEGGYL